MAVVTETGAMVSTGVDKTEQQCRHCGSKGNVKRCSVCKHVYYCNLVCQKADIRRHREEDRCGSTSAISAPCEATYSRNTVVAATAASSGPRCRRCQKSAGEVGQRYFAEIVCRSIFPSDCDHGPFCSSCAARLERQTLCFCPGCRALVRRLEADGNGKEAVKNGSESKGVPVGEAAVEVLKVSEELQTSPEAEDTRELDRLD
eukprot:TRINITY_DN4201_c0_g1_i1.p1 TRINITY_DN4201_c0_g1~~TRINITY_DN4201_c0_g1_i1.p1  ORF type:complete len:238 (+),score=20.75 TRINITY_DN4201_c0_g1_i1:107-715(+)